MGDSNGVSKLPCRNDQQVDNEFMLVVVLTGVLVVVATRVMYERFLFIQVSKISRHVFQILTYQEQATCLAHHSKHFSIDKVDYATAC